MKLLLIIGLIVVIILLCIIGYLRYVASKTPSIIWGWYDSKNQTLEDKK